MVNGSHPGELKKDFDSALKGNTYYLDGHKIIIPAVSGQGENGKQQTGKLDIIHRYIVMQIYLASGDPFSFEIHIRDKHNVIIFNLRIIKILTYLFRTEED